MRLAPNGLVRYYPDFMSGRAADQVLPQLREGLDWQQLPIKMFGRRILQPRLTAYYGDPGADYRYSGLQLKAQPWPAALAELRDAVACQIGERFNSVLCNLYRHGRDYMGWHADNEPELGVDPLIASVSLGAERRFALKPRDGTMDREVFELASGSLLVMSGDLQRHWLHQLPRSQRVNDERINLTFRYVVKA